MGGALVDLLMAQHWRGATSVYFLFVQGQGLTGGGVCNRFVNLHFHLCGLKYKINPLFLSPLSEKAILVLSPRATHILTF